MQPITTSKIYRFVSMWITILVLWLVNDSLKFWEVVILWLGFGVVYALALYEQEFFYKDRFEHIDKILDHLNRVKKKKVKT